MASWMGGEAATEGGGGSFGLSGGQCHIAKFTFLCCATTAGDAYAVGGPTLLLLWWQKHQYRIAFKWMKGHSAALDFSKKLP
jgi:hypothetical protein